MVIRGVPNDIENYYMADGVMAYALQKAGLQPNYIDDTVVYFKINNKLRKTLDKLGAKLDD